MKRRVPGRPTHPRAASALIVAGLLTLAGSSATAEDDPFPFPVKIEVVQEGTVAADRSLRLLEAAILTELRRRGCVREATTGGKAREDGARAVVLRVILRDVVEEARWDVHTGARAEALQLSGENSVWPTAFIRLLGQSQVLAGPQQRVRVGGERFQRQRSREFDPPQLAAPRLSKRRERDVFGIP